MTSESDILILVESQPGFKRRGIAARLAAMSGKLTVNARAQFEQRLLR